MSAGARKTRLADEGCLQLQSLEEFGTADFLVAKGIRDELT
jgi:hypothetical protein